MCHILLAIEYTNNQTNPATQFHGSMQAARCELCCSETGTLLRAAARETGAGKYTIITHEFKSPSLALRHQSEVLSMKNYYEIKCPIDVNFWKKIRTVISKLGSNPQAPVSMNSLTLLCPVLESTVRRRALCSQTDLNSKNSSQQS